MVGGVTPSISVRALACLFAVLAVAAPLSAAAPVERTGFEPLKIVQTSPAQYPETLDTVDFPTGEVVMIINVDAEGRLADMLVERSTNAAFADAAERALRAWQYVPAKRFGEPMGTRVGVLFRFEPRRVVTAMTGRTYLERRMEQMAGIRTRAHVVGPRELDEPLQPVEVVSPLTPLPAGTEANARVVLDFYVDGDGRPRMPVVVAAASELHALSAVDALEQWRFTRPRSRGQPVAVRVQQEFRFEPESLTPVGER
jgi:TonB family protein